MAGMMRYFRRHEAFFRRAGIAVLLLISFTLRVWNLNWDQGTHQHPDERYWSIVTADLIWEDPTGYFDSQNSTMNPYQSQDTWVYGTLPLFSVKAAAEFLEMDWFVSANIVKFADALGINLLESSTDMEGNTFQEKLFNSRYEVQLVGRLLSALLDSGTVLLVYFLGKAIFNRSVGFLSSILLTFTPLHLQYSHFHGSEIWTTFFVTTVVLLSIYLFNLISSKSSNAPPFDAGIFLRASTIGAFIGMATASKFNAFLIFAAPLTVYALVCFRNTSIRSNTRRQGTYRIADFLSLLSATGLSAITSFRIFQPYAFDGFWKLSKDFIADLNYLEAVNSGGNYPWVVQWVGRNTLLYPLESIFWSGMGPAISITVCLGLALGIREIIRNQNFILLAPLSAICVMVCLVAQQFNPLIRYLLPIYPTAIVFGGYGIYKLWIFGKVKVEEKYSWSVLSKAGTISAALLLSVSIFWGAAFINGVYNSTHPKIEASTWINKNIDAGSTLTSQLWDDSLPIRDQNFSDKKYGQVQLDLFRPDSWVDPETGVSKTGNLLNQLDQSDYIVEASNRIYDSVPRIPAKYPATSAYFRSLFSGELGFRQVAEFKNTPSLFGLDLPSRITEETFSVYDHPTVTIWEKTSDWSIERAEAILNPFAAARAPNLEPSSGAWNALMLEPEVAKELESGSTFNEMFSPSGTSGSLSWLWWFLWLQLAAFLVLPWSLPLFSSLKDNGYGLSKILGFLTSGLLTWILVSWDLFKFNSTTCILSVIIIGVFGIVNSYRKRKYLIDLARSSRNIWLVTEIVFTLAFLSVLLLRYMNPDLWDSYRGGEKPMELGYLTSIGRSSELPPYDPWFAGGVINYYYFGWFLLAVPMRTLGILPEITFQLGIATFVSLAVIGVWTLAVNLIRSTADSRISNRKNLSSSLILGTLAVLFFSVFGTFDAIRRHHQRFSEISSWNFLSDWPFIGSLVETFGGLWAWVRGTRVDTFDWWGPSRVNSGNFDITEFPFFTFLFGDLHPHLMGMCLFALVLCLCFSYAIHCRNGEQKSSALIAVATGIGLAVVRMTNTWDFPTLVLISIASLLYGISVFKVRSLEDNYPTYFGESGLWIVTGLSLFVSSLISGGGFLSFFALFVVSVACIGTLVSSTRRYRLLILLRHVSLALSIHVIVINPFRTRNQTFDLGLHRSEWVSPFSDFLSHWGLFISIATVYFITIFLETRKGNTEKLPRKKTQPNLMITKRVMQPILLALTLLLGITVGWAFAISVLGAGMAFLFLIETTQVNPSKVARIFSLLLLTLGFLLLAGPEILTVNNDVARMNTVFKFWLQSWIVFSVASAFAIWEIWIFIRDRDNRDPRVFSLSRIAGIGFTCLLLVGLTYPASSFVPRISDRFSTAYKGLNGIAYLQEKPLIVRYDNGTDEPPSQVSIGDDLPIIQWLRESVKGSPTIVEWTGDSYDWNSRISIHTGLPTVLGWSSHQRQQRLNYQSLIAQRKQDVQRLYQIPDQKFATQFLLTYNVRYIIVGTQERRFGDNQALLALDTHPALDIVFEDTLNKIYFVDTEKLWELTQ